MCEVPLVSRPEGIKIGLGPHLEGRHQEARTSGAEDEYSSKKCDGMASLHSDEVFHFGRKDISLRFGPFVEKENIRIDTRTVVLDQDGKEFSI